jgi:hypothetical protein
MIQPPPYGNSYDQLLALLRQRVRDQNVEEKILEHLQSSFEQALRIESAVLALPERERLFRTIAGEVLDKVRERVDKGDHA